MLKVECDSCHRITEVAESYGPGIAGDSAKPYVWESPDNLTFKIEAINHQLCGECVGLALSQLLQERWPDFVWPRREVTFYDQDADGSEGADTDVPGVRAGGEVQESSPSIHTVLSDSRIEPNPEAVHGVGGGTGGD